MKPIAAALKPVAMETRWRAAESAEGLRVSIERLTALLLAYEDAKGLRTRARKAADQEKFSRAVEAICCNFAAIAMFDPARKLAVKFGNYASGQSSVYGAHFKRAVRLMEECGLIIQAKGFMIARTRLRMPSTIHPTPKFWTHFSKPTGWDALRLEDHTQPVVVNGVEAGYDVPHDWLLARVSEMMRINDHLKSIALSYAGSQTIPPIGHATMPTILLVTPHHRTVRRVFKGSIERGARLYHGFWETMPRAQRFRNLTINEMPVVNVDYGQLFLRLAYALSKQEPPRGDLYDLTGHDHERHDWPLLREGRKRMVNALIATSKPLKQWPGGSIAERQELRAFFPPGTKPSQVVASIKARHSAIAAEWLQTGRGLELHRLESDILIAVLLRLIDLEVSALPMHDSVIVARSDGQTARRVMEEEARRLTGAEIPVKIDAG